MGRACGQLQDRSRRVAGWPTASPCTGGSIAGTAALLPCDLVAATAPVKLTQGAHMLHAASSVSRTEASTPRPSCPGWNRVREAGGGWRLMLSLKVQRLAELEAAAPCTSASSQGPQEPQAPRTWTPPPGSLRAESDGCLCWKLGSPLLASWR